MVHWKYLKLVNIKNMVLKENIYELINTSEIRLKLAIALNVGETTIRNYINNHSDQLTLASALKLISEETGIPVNKLLTESIPA